VNLKQNLRLRLRKSQVVLGKSIRNVRNFLIARLNPDGGFQNRSGKSDLYYTVFGLDALMGLGEEILPGKTDLFIRSQPSLHQLDLVHLGSFIRCVSNLSGVEAMGLRDELLEKLKRFQSLDGGFNRIEGSETGTLYGSYIAYAAMEDLGVQYPAPEKLASLIQSLRQPDGGYANSLEMSASMTPPTSAGLTLLSLMGKPADAGWLLSNIRKGGGIKASAEAPYPDLLSTATGLAALSLMGVDLIPYKEKTLDFIDSLWNGAGGFHGHWEDEELDCEYTYYGLLALGCLAE
jgi:prenyltransferase beta subunit